ncbi:MAG: carbohydrate kinase family protein [Mycobacteriales bacterium]
MITVCGEALIDLVSTPGGRPPTYVAHPGGSAANVAVAAARLGADTSLLARVSNDAFGRMVREHVVGNGVSGRDLVGAAEPTTLAVATLDEAGRARYDFYSNGTADWQWSAAELPNPFAADVTAFHTGSLATVMGPGAVAVAALVEREHERGAVTLSYDPNIRPALVGDRDTALANVQALLRCFHVVKVSDEDLAWLLPGEKPLDVARRWREYGPAVVVVTLGERGAIAVGPSGAEVAVTPRPVTVVDTVGAGDAFTAGLLTGLASAGLLDGGPAALATLDDATLRQVLDRAALVATLTCTRPGADPPTAAELAALP